MSSNLPMSIDPQSPPGLASGIVIPCHVWTISYVRKTSPVSALESSGELRQSLHPPCHIIPGPLLEWLGLFLNRAPQLRYEAIRVKTRTEYLVWLIMINAWLLISSIIAPGLPPGAVSIISASALTPHSLDFLFRYRRWAIVMVSIRPVYLDLICFHNLSQRESINAWLANLSVVW